MIKVTRREPETEQNVSSISDEELLRRAVKSARSRACRKGSTEFRWAGVSWAFSLGSTYSAQLCRRFGLDPFEMVRK